MLYKRAQIAQMSAPVHIKTLLHGRAKMMTIGAGCRADIAARTRRERSTEADRCVPIRSVGAQAWRHD